MTNNFWPWPLYRIRTYRPFDRRAKGDDNREQRHSVNLAYYYCGTLYIPVCSFASDMDVMSKKRCQLMQRFLSPSFDDLLMICDFQVKHLFA